MFDRIRQIMFPFTVLEAFAEFETYLLAQSKPEDKEKINLRNYRTRLGSFMKLHGSKRFNQLVPSHADAWIAEMNGRGLTQVSINGYTQALQTFERFVRQRYKRLLKKEQPFSLHLKQKEAPGRSDETIPNDEEIVRAVQVAYAMLESDSLVEVRDATIFLWTVETGTRRRETAQLKLSGLSLDKPTLVYDDLGNPSFVYEAKVDGKRGKDTVDITEELARILHQWLQVRPGDSDYVFVGAGTCGRHKGEPPPTCHICKTYGQPVSVSAVRDAFASIAERAGVDPHKLGAHGARHWFGQRAVDMTNLEVARQRLRHRDIRTTAKIYGHQDKARRKQGAVTTSILPRPAKPDKLDSLTLPKESSSPDGTVDF